MDEGPGTALRRVRRSKVRGNKAWIVTTAVGATLLVVSAIVFAVSAGTKGLTTHAESVHIADETLRIATVARAQVAMANHFASIERELSVAVDDQLITSTEQATSALDLMAVGIEQLEDFRWRGERRACSAFSDFDRLSREVLDLIAADRSEEAIDDSRRATRSSVRNCVCPPARRARSSARRRLPGPTSRWLVWAMLLRCCWPC